MRFKPHESACPDIFSDWLFGATGRLMLELGVSSWSMQSTYMDPRPFGDLYREVIHHAQLTEALGFDSFWMGEHHHSYDGYCPATLTTASGILAATQKLIVGLGITILPVHGAERIAEGVAAVASFAPGRLRPCLAAGWKEVEFSAMGLVRGDRKRLMDQYSEELFTGRLAARVNGAELWFGGAAPVMLKRAGRFGAGFYHNFVNVQTLQERNEIWRSAMPPSHMQDKRPPNVIVFDFWADRNPERCNWIKQRMREQWRFYAAHDQLPDNVADREANIDVMNSNSIVGTPEQIVEAMAPYVPLTDGIVFRIRFDGLDGRLVDECLALLGGEVAPALRRMKN